ncbi:MAG: ferritin family protein [candidate division WOR-3 bacterium]|nr:ferritin family protein [candidate division WOR-3 bacterium]
MPIFYSPVELIELAVSLERNGAQFYQELSKSTSAKPLKNLFVFLAKEEKKHERFFRTLYKKTQEDPTTIAYNFDEMKLYLKAITESRVFL